MSDKLIVMTSGEFKLFLTDIFNDCFAANSYSNQISQLQPQSKTGNATRKQAREFLGGISAPTLADWTKTGKVKGHRIGRRVLYRWADLEAALTAIKTGGK